MLPSELRLLRGIRDALDGVARTEGAPSKAAIAAINVAVNELMLRANRGFFVTHYAEGRRLGFEGLVLGRGKVSDELSSAVGALPAALDASLHFDAIGACLDALAAVLESLVRALAPLEQSGVQGVSDFLARIVDWENGLKAYRLKQAEESAPAAATTVGEFTPESLSRYLHRRFPEGGEPKVSSLQSLSGGFSKLTVLFDVEDASGRQSLVLRAEQPANLLFLEGADVANEYHVLKLAHAAGLAVPEALWLEQDVSALGARFLVSRKASGRNIGTAISVNEKISEGLLGDMVQHLARIHAVRVDPDDPCVRRSHFARWRKFASLKECVAQQISFWKENVERLELPPSPTLARIFEWLAANVPDSNEPPCFIHSDYGLHNILIENDRVSSILDWESATLGDPAEDFVWFADGLRGHADREHLLDLYLKAGGLPFSEQRMRYFDVFRSLKYAVVCPTALKLFERHRSANIAACQLGLLFPYYGTVDLNKHIGAAEKARTATGQSTVGKESQ